MHAPKMGEACPGRGVVVVISTLFLRVCSLSSMLEIVEVLTQKRYKKRNKYVLYVVVKARVLITHSLLCFPLSRTRGDCVQ